MARTEISTTTEEAAHIQEDGTHTGIMVAFFLDSSAAQRLALPGGEPVDQLHITLSFLGDSADFTGDTENLKQVLAHFATDEHSLVGETSGIGRFAPQGSDVTPIYVSVDVKGLHSLRDRLCTRLISCGYPVNLSFAYQPHITLAYIDASADMPIESVPTIALNLDTLCLVVGDDRTYFDLHGTQPPGERPTHAEEALTVKQRAKIDDSNFAWPDAPGGPKYPIDTQDHLDSAATLIGHAPEDKQPAIKKRAITIATRNKLQLPDTWKDGTTESTTEAETTFQPKARIAQLKVRFLSDDAISRNGRQYPATTVNRLVSTGQNAITSGQIINAYICHGVADEDNPLVVSGKATNIWKEGNLAYAMFDIPDTNTGRDMVSLLNGGYIPPTMSLRASNAEMQVVKGKGLPQVVGNNITLDGIDFTARPGLPDARIENIVLENAAIESEGSLHDSFYLSDISLISEQEDESTMAANKATAPVPEKPETTKQEITQEDANQILKPLVSGDSQGVDDSTPGSAFTKTYPQLHATPPDGLMASTSMNESRQTHDHIAAALGMPCAPKTQEAGRKFNKAAESHMVAIHDMHAGKLGLECVGSYQQMASPQNPTDDDDDSNNLESVQQPSTLKIIPTKETKPMSLEAARALLEAQGYTTVPPKTEAEKLQESFDAKFAAQQAQFEAMLKQQQEAIAKQIAESQPVAPRAQRKTLVESNTNEQQPLTDSPRTRRTRIQENLMSADWEKLADRSEPLPTGVSPEMLLEHFGRLMLHDHQQKYGNQSVRPSHS
jgi:2'-5' RNA ligase